MGDVHHVTCLVASSSEILKDDVSMKLAKRFGNIGILRTSTFEETESAIETGDADILIIGSILLGFELEERVTALYRMKPGLKILCFCGNSCPRQFGLRLFRAGVNGIFLDRSDCLKADECVERILDGKQCFPSDIEEAIRNREYLFYPEENGSLTEREHEVLQYMLQGTPLKEASNEMNISVGAVSSMRARIQKKLGAQNYADVVLISLQYGLMDHPVNVGGTMRW